MVVRTDRHLTNESFYQCNRCNTEARAVPIASVIISTASARESRMHLRLRTMGLSRKKHAMSMSWSGSQRWSLNGRGPRPCRRRIPERVGLTCPDLHTASGVERYMCMEKRADGRAGMWYDGSRHRLPANQYSHHQYDDRRKGGRACNLCTRFWEQGSHAQDTVLANICPVGGFCSICQPLLTCCTAANRDSGSKRMQYCAVLASGPVRQPPASPVTVEQLNWFSYREWSILCRRVLVIPYQSG